MTGDGRLVRVTPSPRQLRHEEMEFYAFVHFSVNTFTGREWGDGTESPDVFRPDRLDADQWVRAVKDAGMKGLILTCKHHDGFCLWPSRLTDHSVARSPWKDGRGDVVREVSDACARAGIAFGVYLSPWDRHSPLYGQGKPYDDYFAGQLTELLTQYGPVFCVWLDGACGEGPGGRKQRYDWARYEAVIRALQPETTIHVCGPDVRWCGNEAGETRPAEWSVVTARTADTERIASLSQRTDDAAFRLRRIRATDRDLGSREILRDEPDLIWYPAEVNTSIRPGWFYHASEDGRVKTTEELADLYERAVGGNASLLLNIPPTPAGLFHETDVGRLRELGEWLRRTYAHNLLEDEGARCRADSALPGAPSEAALRPDRSHWMPENPAAVWEGSWGGMKPVRRVVLMEDTRCSQRIERYAVELRTEAGWVTACEGLTVGHKAIVRIPDLRADALRVRITDARGAPALRFAGAYEALPF